MTASIVWAADPATGRDVPLWAPRKEFRCAAAEQLRAAGRRRQMEEHNRLLYVALTRAEDRLLVCGWHTRTAPKDECWHSLVARGFEALGAERGTIRPLGRRSAPPASAASVPRRNGTARAKPMHPAPCPPGSVQRRAGARAAAARTPQTHAPGAKPARGSASSAPCQPPSRRWLNATAAACASVAASGSIHCCSICPTCRPEARWDAAVRFVDKPGHALPAGEAERIADEVLAVMAHPDLVPLFGPQSRAEVPLTGVVADSVVGGIVDRLVVLPDRVLVADFKTNRRPPARVEQTPVMYLRQMASLPRRPAGNLPGPGRPLRFDLDARRPCGGVAGRDARPARSRACKGRSLTAFAAGPTFRATEI